MSDKCRECASSGWLIYFTESELTYCQIKYSDIIVFKNSAWKEFMDDNHACNRLNAMYTSPIPLGQLRYTPIRAN